MAPHTSLRVGGPADYFVEARSCVELVEALRWARAEGVPVRVIGGGSNLLVADAGVEGQVIKAVGASFEVIGETVRADAGVNLANMARRLAKQGWGGLEWAANVPGTVGGAVVNNAGAFGGDTASWLDSVSLVDESGRVQTLSAAELGYAYRTSVLKRRELVLDDQRKLVPDDRRVIDDLRERALDGRHFCQAEERAAVPTLADGRAVPTGADGRAVPTKTEVHIMPTVADVQAVPTLLEGRAGQIGPTLAVVQASFRLLRSTPQVADGKVKAFNAQRMKTQPRILSAGSVFANPEGDFAGRLIEAAGLKGYRVGGAQVSEQHANFIVNPGGATADDVYRLLRAVQDRVFEHAGVRLKPEIEFLGRWP